MAEKEKKEKLGNKEKQPKKAEKEKPQEKTGVEEKSKKEAKETKEPAAGKAKKAGAKEAKTREAPKKPEETKAEPKAGGQESAHVKAEIAHRGKPEYKGKKQGKRPEKQAWVDYSPADVEKLVASLAAAGHNSAEIGMMIAEQYAVPSVKAITGKRIEKIMAEHKVLGEMPRDLLDLIKKSVKLLNHMKQNKKDMSAKRGYEVTVSKIRKAAAYYAKNGKIRAGWRYTPEEAVLLVK